MGSLRRGGIATSHVAYIQDVFHVFYFLFYFIYFYFISFANRQGHRNSLRQLLRARNYESILRREETEVPGENPRSQVEIDSNSIHIQHCRGGRRD